MALRINKLRVERSSPELSRSYPKAGGNFKNCLPQCVQGTGSLESVASTGYGNSGNYLLLYIVRVRMASLTYSRNDLNNIYCNSGQNKPYQNLRQGSTVLSMLHVHVKCYIFAYLCLCEIERSSRICGISLNL